MWNSIVTWFKTSGIKLAVDSLNLATPYLAQQIDSIDKKFKDMSSTDKANWIVNQVQTYLRSKFGLTA